LEKVKKVLAFIFGWAYILLMAFGLITKIFGITFESSNDYKPASTYHYKSDLPISIDNSSSYIAKPTPKPRNLNLPAYNITATVYITESGSKYHQASCQYLWHSCIKVDLSWAKSNGYTPCSKCHPPN